MKDHYTLNKEIASMHFYVSDYESCVHVAIFSYQQLIAVYYKSKTNANNIDLDLDNQYYSNTTRRHQGIAYAMLKAIKEHGIGFFETCVYHSKSLKDLIKHFGYYGLDVRHLRKDIDGINIDWSYS